MAFVDGLSHSGDLADKLRIPLGTVKSWIRRSLAAFREVPGPMSDAPDYDLLAGEYVLGTLEGEEAAEAARLLATRPHVRCRRSLLGRTPDPPCHHAVLPNRPAPDLWDRIDAATTTKCGSVPPPPAHLATEHVGCHSAIAASLAAFIVLHAPPPPRVAVL